MGNDGGGCGVDEGYAVDGRLMGQRLGDLDRYKGRGSISRGKYDCVDVEPTSQAGWRSILM